MDLSVSEINAESIKEVNEDMSAIPFNFCLVSICLLIMAFRK